MDKNHLIQVTILTDLYFKAKELYDLENGGDYNEIPLNTVVPLPSNSKYTQIYALGFNYACVWSGGHLPYECMTTDDILALQSVVSEEYDIDID